MRNFKRFLTLALAMVMLVSAFAMGTSAAKFTDVDEENEYLTKAVNLLSYVGVTKGTTDTTFGTDELVTREQMAAFIYRLMKKGNSVEGGANTSAFTDLEDATFFFMVSWANNQGIIKGTSATTFDPKGSITLQDAYTMVVRALGYENEETLPYPFGYIDVAESKDVALNEGLGSEVSYTDALTRGDVAVILYNAFFAETGVAETEQVERLLGDETNGNWVLETVTTYPTFCEKYFDVEEVEYQAIATPNYVFDIADETTENLGYEAIEFKYVGEEKTDAPAQFYAAFEDLGLEGEADDYIMSHFAMYIVLDDKDEIEEILYAEPLMVKKNVTELKLGELATANKASYYDNSDYSVKRLSGKVEFDGEVAYFYGAPYSYISPKYTAKAPESLKYEQRNANNLKFIEMVDFDKEENEFKFVFKDNDIVNPMFSDNAPKYTLEHDDKTDKDVIKVNYEVAADDYYKNDSVKLANELKEVFVGGLYEADMYDVDGDGIYDYINYMPYSAYFVNTDEDYTYSDNAFDDANKTEVYTGEAVLAGVEFEDGDYVIGYFSKEANYMKVAAVVAPVEGSITAIKKATGTITLNGETKVSVKDGWKTINNYDVKPADFKYIVEDYDWTKFDNLLTAGALDEDDAKFYVYNDVLLYQEGIDSFITFAGKLAIITEDEEDGWYDTGSFNPVTGKRATYVHAWIDGETKYVPVDMDAEIYPEYDSDFANYLNKIATYSVDENGLYTFELISEAENEKGEYVGITWFDKLEADKDFSNEDKADIQGYNEYASAYLVKNSGNRFRLRAEATRTGAAVEAFDFILDNNTIVLIKNTYVEDGETVIDFVNELPTETLVNELTNIQVIVANNVDYTNRENLVVLYAEVDGEELEGVTKDATKSERIIKMKDVAMNENGKYYAVYDLFNPYTGALVENVAGTNVSTTNSYESKFTYGDIVEVDASGKVKDKSGDAKVGTIIGGNADLYWVVDYNAEEDALEIIEVPSISTEPTKDNLDDIRDELEDAVENAQVYRINVEDVKVSIIGHQSAALNADMVRWGSIKVADVAKLDGSDKSYLATAKWAKDDDSALKTVYSNYVKIYLDAEWEDENDPTVVNEDDFNAEANFIVVVANNNETEALCKLK